MAELRKPFDSYQINYYSGMSELSNDVTIGCRSGDDYVGIINFFKDNKQLPK